MSTEENKARVHRFYEEVFNRKNTAALDEFIDPQAVDHAAPVDAPGGIAGAKQFAGMFLAAFPDVRFTVEAMVADGDQVVARLTQSGTHQGMFLGLPPTGKRVTVTGIEIFRLTGGKIVEHWNSYDDLGLFQQLGVLPSSHGVERGVTSRSTLCRHPLDSLILPELLRRETAPMATWNIPALLFAVALSLAMAIAGGLLTGNQLTRWFATLHKPRFQLPLWGFVCVGLYGYLVDSVIAYRLLTVVPGQTARILALTALIVVMLYNELWNIVLFRWHNTLAGFLGVLVFLIPLAVFQVTLVLVDHVSAWLVLVYLVWVIGYDIPWAYRLWRLNVSS